MLPNILQYTGQPLPRSVQNANGAKVEKPCIKLASYSFIHSTSFVGELSRAERLKSEAENSRVTSTLLRELMDRSSALGGSKTVNLHTLKGLGFVIV